MTGSPDDPKDLAVSGGEIRFAPDRVRSPDSSLFDPANTALNAQAVQVGGRQSAWFVQGDFGPAVLRHYRRGGMIARLSRDRYIWRDAQATRSFAEFDLLHFMYQKGLPVPKPLAAAYWRRGLTYRAAIMVERIANVRTLAKCLAEPNHDPVARAIFAMHDAGVWHADLNAYNILLNEQGFVWLIDFDRGRRMPLSRRHRQANLLRLRRSLIKVAGQAGLEYWVEVNRAYMQLMQGRAHL